MPMTFLPCRYETLPINGADSRMPGYAGFIPGKLDCYA